jgi:hypothetical protein
VSSYERLMARIAAVRSRIDAGGPSRLPNWRNKPKKKAPPTEGGETRSRAPVLFVPSAKPPDATGRAPNPTPAPVAAVPTGPVVYRGSCKARCALSGRRCQLPAHGNERQHHDGRRPFYLVAGAEQERFPERERLEDAATTRMEVPLG